jgi:hypothetical protein
MRESLALLERSGCGRDDRAFPSVLRTRDVVTLVDERNV